MADEIFFTVPGTDRISLSPSHSPAGSVTLIIHLTSYSSLEQVIVHSIPSLPKITQAKKKSHPKPHTPETPYFIRDSRCETGLIWYFRDKPSLPQHPTTTEQCKTAQNMMGRSQFTPTLPWLRRLTPIQPYLHSHQTFDLPVLLASIQKCPWQSIKPLWSRCMLQWGSASPSLNSYVLF